MAEDRKFIRLMNKASEEVLVVWVLEEMEDDVSFTVESDPAEDPTVDPEELLKELEEDLEE